MGVMTSDWWNTNERAAQRQEKQTPGDVRSPGGLSFVYGTDYLLWLSRGKRVYCSAVGRFSMFIIELVGKTDTDLRSGGYPARPKVSICFSEVFQIGLGSYDFCMAGAGARRAW